MGWHGSRRPWRSSSWLLLLLLIPGRRGELPVVGFLQIKGARRLQQPSKERKCRVLVAGDQSVAHTLAILDYKQQTIKQVAT